MLEDRIREIAREVFAEEMAKRQSDRPDDPVTGAQVRLVHARRSAAGVSQDELKALLGERFAVESLTGLSQVRLDELLEWLAARGAASMTAEDVDRKIAEDRVLIERARQRHSVDL